MYLIVIENVIIALVTLFVITQLILPVLSNQPTFPMFRWKGKKQELEDVLHDEEEARLERQIAYHKQKVNDLKETDGVSDDTHEL